MDESGKPMNLQTAGTLTVPTEREGRRARVITEEHVKKLELAFRIDATDGEACAYAGVHMDAFREMKKNDEEFRSRIDAAKKYPFLTMKKVVLDAAMSGDGKLALKWLQNRQRDRYHQKVEEEITQTTVEALLDAAEKGVEYADAIEVDSVDSDSAAEPTA